MPTGNLRANIIKMKFTSSLSADRRASNLLHLTLAHRPQRQNNWFHYTIISVFIVFSISALIDLRMRRFAKRSLQTIRTQATIQPREEVEKGCPQTEEVWSSTEDTEIIVRPSKSKSRAKRRLVFSTLSVFLRKTVYAEIMTPMIIWPDQCAPVDPVLSSSSQGTFYQSVALCNFWRVAGSV